jgi:hypothetical protein
MLGAFFCILSIQMGFVIKSLLLTFILAYGTVTLWHDALLLSSRSILGLRQMEDGSWHLLTKKKVLVGQLSLDSTVTSVVCVLRFTILNKFGKRSVLIYQDSVEKDLYRRLLVQLKSF